MSALEGAFRKLRRADEHLSALKRQMAEWLSAQEYTVTEETEANRASNIRQFVDPPELPGDWAYLIGDFAYNARAALDYLAWQLAIMNEPAAKSAAIAGTEWPPERTQYPVIVHIGDARHRKRHEAALAKTFLARHASVIDAEQPYRRGKLAHAQPLWLLHRLRNTDAHRTLHTVLASVPATLPDLVRVESTPAGGVRVEIADTPHRFEELTIGPGHSGIAKLTIKTDLAPYVSFDQPGADFDGQEVLPLLHRCRDEVERILSLFVTDFPHIISGAGGIGPAE